MNAVWLHSFSNVDINFWLIAYEIVMFLELVEEKTLKRFIDIEQVDL